MRAAVGTDQERTDLTRSIADILITAYPKRDSNAFTAALADAEIIARSVLDRDLQED